MKNSFFWIFGGSFLGCELLWNYFRKKHNESHSQFKEFANKQIYTPESLLDKIADTSSNMIKNLTKTEEKDEFLCKNMLVAGRIGCGNPLSTQIPNYPLVLYISKTIPIQNEDLIEKKQSISKSDQINTVDEFLLWNNSKFCEIACKKDTELIDCLELISEKTEFSLPWWLRIALKLAQITSQYFRVLPFSSIIPIGKLSQEWGIKIGTKLIVLGDLTYNSLSKTLSIKNPLKFMKDKASLLEILKKNCSFQSIRKWLFFAGMLVFGFLFIKKIMEKFRKKVLEWKTNELTDIEKAQLLSQEPSPAVQKK